MAHCHFPHKHTVAPNSPEDVFLVSGHIIAEIVISKRIYQYVILTVAIAQSHT